MICIYIHVGYRAKIRWERGRWARDWGRDGRVGECEGEGWERGRGEGVYVGNSKPKAF